MEKKQQVLLGVLFLVVLALLTFLRVVYAVDGACCDWRAESVEWPVGASQCPASPGGANVTYCCGLCHAAPRPALEEAWQACPHDGEEEEEEELPPVASGSSSGSLSPVFALIIPGIFLIVFVCAWLWLKDEFGDHPDETGTGTGTSSSFVTSQLRSRDLPPRYGAFSRKFMTDTQAPPAEPSLSGDTRVRFYQPTSEDDEDFLPPVIILGGQEAEPASGGGQEAEPAFGGALEVEPAFGGALEVEPAFGGALEVEPASGDAQEAEPVSGGAEEAEPGSGGAQGEEPASGDVQEEEPALPTE
ncbi:UNVERIFIED_CONTAM: hypothetical protein K2H54_048553 [Gekko kuhli]